MGDEDWLGQDIDFTIARGMRDPEKIRKVRDYFSRQSKEFVRVDRETINDSVSWSTPMTKSEAESLFTGLVLAGAATEDEKGATFADYTFYVDCVEAARILEGQRIGREAMDQVAQTDSRGYEAVLTATLPSGMDGFDDGQIRQLSSDVRQLFFDADSTVRIANPYFDESRTVIEDIASLVNRGVTTKILTRETHAGGSGARSAVNSIYDEVSTDNRRHLKVRDLYRRDDETGRQSVATHAKIVIADDSPCYVGSANLTEMNLANNFEMGVLMWGNIVSNAIHVFDHVFESSEIVNLPI